MAPFLGALAIIVVVVIAIVLLNLFGDNELPPISRSRRAAVGQNDALQRASYPDFVAYTCRSQQGKEAEVLARQRDSLDKRGHRTVEDVVDVRIDGDKATAIVTVPVRDGAGNVVRRRNDVRTRGRNLEGLFDRSQVAVEDSQP